MSETISVATARTRSAPALWLQMKEQLENPAISAPQHGTHRTLMNLQAEDTMAITLEAIQEEIRTLCQADHQAEAEVAYRKDNPNSKALRQTSQRLTFSPFGALASSSVAPIRKPAQLVRLADGPGARTVLDLALPVKLTAMFGVEPIRDTCVRAVVWSSAAIDPKRKSVDNLLEQLGTSKVPIPPSARTLSSFDQHGPEEETLAAQPVQSKAASRRLPPNSHKPLRCMVPRPRSLPPFVGMFGHQNPL
ncbi:hypothetical protein BC826DRAFT_1110002 [Russula brevipes]|nr:hypothetical protein BC826DRAFT_1110002 [Russula brevipes]